MITVSIWSLIQPSSLKSRWSHVGSLRQIRGRVQSQTWIRSEHAMVTTDHISFEIISQTRNQYLYHYHIMMMMMPTNVSLMRFSFPRFPCMSPATLWPPRICWLSQDSCCLRHFPLQLTLQKKLTVNFYFLPFSFQPKVGRLLRVKYKIALGKHWSI